MALRTITGHEAMVLDFMTRNGKVSYQRSADMLRTEYALAKTDEQRTEIERDFDENITAAVDRYEDWVSDPLD